LALDIFQHGLLGKYRLPNKKPGLNSAEIRVECALFLRPWQS
jgi:hypothetical protein